MYTTSKLYYVYLSESPNEIDQSSVSKHSYKAHLSSQVVVVYNLLEWI